MDTKICFLVLTAVLAVNGTEFNLKNYCTQDHGLLRCLGMGAGTYYYDEMTESIQRIFISGFLSGVISLKNLTTVTHITITRSTHLSCDSVVDHLHTVYLSDGSTIYACKVQGSTTMMPDTNQDTAASMNRLVTELLESYNNHIIPTTAGINVTHALTLLRIVSLEDQVLTLNAWLGLEWTDNRLRWDPELHDDIKAVRIPASMVWQPDIVLFYPEEPFDGFPGQDFNVMITNEGKVSFFPQVRTKTYCEDKPHTTKGKRKVECELSFGSWTYDGNMIDLYPQTDSIDVSSYKENPTWKYKGGSVKRGEIYYPCCPEPYVNILYTLTLKKMDVDSDADVDK